MKGTFATLKVVFSIHCIYDAFLNQSLQNIYIFINKSRASFVLTIFSEKRNVLPKFWNILTKIHESRNIKVGFFQGLASCASVPAWVWENGERMRKWRGNRERMRKSREIHSLRFLIFSLFPPSLSISYIKKCHICRKILNTALLSRMSQKN